MLNMSSDLDIFTSPIIYLFNFVLARVTLSMKNMKLSYLLLMEKFVLHYNATSHTILKDLKYFSYLNMKTSNVSTLYSNPKLIKGF